MFVMILEKVPVGLRGELSRWLIEPRSGVFVGDISARIRDILWEKAIEKGQGGGVIQIWSAKTEQRFDLRISGETKRELMEVEGLKLIRIPQKSKKG